MKGTVVTPEADMNYCPHYRYVPTYLLPVGNLMLRNADSNEDNLHDYDGRKVSTLTLQGRTLYADGSWNTLCRPFSLSAEEVYTQLNPTELKTLGSTSFNSETGTLTLNFIDATAIEAGKPCIIKWTSTHLGDDDFIFFGSDEGYTGDDR